MPVTSRHPAKRTVETHYKSPNRPSVTDRKSRNAMEPEKIWDNVPDTDLHKTVHQITSILLSYDRENILSQVQSSPGKWDISIERIEQKITSREYSDMTDYQADIKQLFWTAAQALDSHMHELLSALYKKAQQLIRAETKRLNAHQPENPLKNSDSSCVEQVQVADDDDTPMEKADDHQPVNSNGIHTTAPTLSDENVRKSLFQVTADGYVFSDMSKTPDWISQADKGRELPPNYQEVVIHPSPLTQQDIGSLSHAVPNYAEQHRRIDRYEQRMVPVEMLDYGAFASFAPKYDSNSATISFESTYMAKTSKQAWRADQKRREREFYGETSIDTAWLKEHGLDADAILNSVNERDEAQCEVTGDMATTIEQNAHLLKRLADLQDERFNLQGEVGSSVSEEELKIASILEERLKGAMAQVAPKDLVDPSTIERAMQRIPTKDPTFRGTLPPTKLFAFTTDEEKVNNASPFAGHTGSRQINTNTLKNH
ncbi:unnamed protein product [Umbelopsis vinacea]